jgi:DNA mismatch repair protein MutS2
VRGFSKPVIFRRWDGSLAEIEAGPLRMKVAVDEITGVEPSAGGGVPAPPLPSSGRANVTVTSEPGEGPASGEINVIGMRVEEATERVDKYLDQAALANQTRVRIIHGHGTGALRKGLGEFLKSHPLVQRTSFETEEHGGKAITVVELRS